MLLRDGILYFFRLIGSLDEKGFLPASCILIFMERSVCAAIISCFSA